MPPSATGESKGYSSEALSSGYWNHGGLHRYATCRDCVRPWQLLRGHQGWRFERRAGTAARELGDGLNNRNSRSTGRLWLLRIGLAALLRPKTIANDWVWLVDHSIQIGRCKCLVILDATARPPRGPAARPSGHGADRLGAEGGKLIATLFPSQRNHHPHGVLKAKPAAAILDL